MKPSWAVPVPPQPSELFSSWLARAALAQGCDPLVLTGDVWPRWRAWVRDLDRGVSVERLTALERASGIPALLLDAMSLRATVEFITADLLDSRAVWPWVLTLGSKNRARLGGLQYCSSCLAIGQTPYYRQEWRLAWHVGCSEHGGQLYDRCWSCKLPVEPHRLQAEDKHLAVCAHCRQDLREVSLIACSEAAVAFQEAADRVVQDGYGYYDQEKLTSHEWFRLARYFLLVIRRVARGRAEGLQAFIKALGIPSSAVVSPSTGLPFEFLSVQERAPLLSGAWHMLNAGPGFFREAAIQASLTRATFSGISQPLPRAITEVVASLPDGSMPRVKTAQANDVFRPRSRQAVMRMYARLQRKLARMS